MRGANMKGMNFGPVPAHPRTTTTSLSSSYSNKSLLLLIRGVPNHDRTLPKGHEF